MFYNIFMQKKIIKLNKCCFILLYLRSKFLFMEIRNILTYRGRLNFKRLSDCDLQLLDCWSKGVIFGSLHVIQVKPSVYYITPRVCSDHDFVCHVACPSYHLVKMLNYYKNNSYKYPDFKFFLVNKFPDIHILKYVS